MLDQGEKIEEVDLPWNPDEVAYYIPEFQPEITEGFRLANQQEGLIASDPYVLAGTYAEISDSIGRVIKIDPSGKFYAAEAALFHSVYVEVDDQDELDIQAIQTVPDNLDILSKDDFDLTLYPILLKTIHSDIPVHLDPFSEEFRAWVETQIGIESDKDLTEFETVISGLCAGFMETLEGVYGVLFKSDDGDYIFPFREDTRVYAPTLDPVAFIDCFMERYRKDYKTYMVERIHRGFHESLRAALEPQD